MHESKATHQLEDFLEKCKAHQLKITPQRTAIYKTLLGSTQHPTADSIFRKIQRDYPNISFDTVNRTLLTFTQIGIIDVIESFSGSRRFDPNLGSHHHIHCIQCGEIFDFLNPEYDQLPIPKTINRKYKIISKRVILNVLCESCYSTKP